jgi:hypothetical protein
MSIWDVQLKSFYEVECWRDGALVWSDSFYNLVTTVGKNILLDQTFFSGTVTPAWYVGLVNDDSFSQYEATDTMASHGGWLEATGYSNATRPAYTIVAASSGSMSNDASRALFNINATATIRGAFLVNESTKGGSTGTLYGEGDFAAARNVVSGDILSIKITLTD